MLTLAAGCSALRIGYSAAPDLVFWWLDGYVDVSSAQAPRVRAAIAQWFAWNRRTQLRDYAGLLARAQTEVLADTSAARVCAWQGEAVQRMHTAFDAILPDAAELALAITPAQIQHLERRYAKYNDELRDEYLQPDPRKRAQASLERTVDRAETLYGGLDDAQRARLADGLARSPFDPEAWLAERRQRQQALLQILRSLGAEHAGREQASAALRRYAEQLEHSPRDAYRAYAARLAEFNCAFAAELHNSTTEAQRRTAARKLAGWESDLRALAAPPSADPS